MGAGRSLAPCSAGRTKEHWGLNVILPVVVDLGAAFQPSLVGFVIALSAVILGQLLMSGFSEIVRGLRSIDDRLAHRDSRES